MFVRCHIFNARRRSKAVYGSVFLRSWRRFVFSKRSIVCCYAAFLFALFC